MRAVEVIDPVDYSIEEARFLITHFGEAPEVAELDGFPAGVNPNAVLPAIERIFRLVQQHEARGLRWVGVEAVKQGFQTYVDVFTAWQQEVRRGAPKYPSQYVWDETGRGHKSAVGSDSGKVTTYFDEYGNRHRFAIELVSGGESDYKPSWVKPQAKRTIPKLLHNEDKGTIECPICHFTQTYDKETRSTYNLALGRMQRHLTGARRDPDAHREVYTQEFGQANV